MDRLGKIGFAVALVNREISRHSWRNLRARFGAIFGDAGNFSLWADGGGDREFA